MNKDNCWLRYCETAVSTAGSPVDASVVLRVNSSYNSVYGDLSDPVTRHITRSYCNAVRILGYTQCFKNVLLFIFILFLLILCCKWPYCDLCILQGSVVTVLKWNGQNCMHLRTLFYDVAVKKLLKSVNISKSFSRAKSDTYLIHCVYVLFLSAISCRQVYCRT